MCVSIHVSIHLFNKCYTAVTSPKEIITPHMATTMTHFNIKYYIFEMSSPFKKVNFVLVVDIHGYKHRCCQHLLGNSVKILPEGGAFTL